MPPLLRGGAKTIRTARIAKELASPFKGRCPEGAERFVPLPDKSLFIDRNEQLL